METEKMQPVERISTQEDYLFHQGTYYEAYKKFGAHPGTVNGVEGTLFTVWAPNAQSVNVLTAKTGWLDGSWYLKRTQNGIWDGFVPGVNVWDVYRYAVRGSDGITRYKSDPFAFHSEYRPDNASVICPPSRFEWTDDDYQNTHRSESVREKPMAIYEVYLGSWKKDWLKQDPDHFYNYRQYADQLAEYLNYMGYTHVELMGICEHPFDGSWGYQVTGFFSPTSRYGQPDDFRYFVNTMHRANIGVILDWVPAHFPKDSFGLEMFDGTPQYESVDPLLAEYPEWNTKAFDHSKPEVRSFLISSAFYWIREFHINALRIDAVAAMMYTNFSRSEWRPNAYGGTQNLDSIGFLKQLNWSIGSFTNGFTIAEDSSIMAGVTLPTDKDGIGFWFKWNMGWMNETLKYFAKDPIYRKWHHYNITHPAEYAFTENFILVLSHDEVVHLKKSMVMKQPGTMEEKMGGLKSLYAYQFTHPGKKLIFMGQDFAMDNEWDESREIDWGLASEFGHRDVMHCVKNLLAIYRRYPVLHSDSGNSKTFEWVNSGDAPRNTISFIRRNPWNYRSALLVICNFSPMQYNHYTCGVPLGGYYSRVFSTYDSLPGAGGPDEAGQIPPVTAIKHDCDGREWMIDYDLRSYEAVVFEFPEPEESGEETKKAGKKK